MKATYFLYDIKWFIFLFSVVYQGLFNLLNFLRFSCNKNTHIHIGLSPYFLCLFMHELSDSTWTIENLNFLFKKEQKKRMRKFTDFGQEQL